jgi:hypothetical protein
MLLAAMALLAGCVSVTSTAALLVPGDTVLVGQVQINMQNANLKNYTKQEGTTKDIAVTSQIEVVFRNSTTGKTQSVVTSGGEGIFLAKAADPHDCVYELTKIIFVKRGANTKVTITLGRPRRFNLHAGVVNVFGNILINGEGEKLSVDFQDNTAYLQDFFKTNHGDSALNDMQWSQS